MEKIAIPTNEGKMWPHFGRAPQFTFVTIDGGKVAAKETKPAPEHNHEIFASYMKENGANTVVCGGMGGGALKAMTDAGVAVKSGAPAIDIDELVAQYISGTIVYGEGGCEHHCSGDHDHTHDHEHGHECGKSVKVTGLAE